MRYKNFSQKGASSEALFILTDKKAVSAYSKIRLPKNLCSNKAAISLLID
jgi:hypothetical protein